MMPADVARRPDAELPPEAVGCLDEDAADGGFDRDAPVGALRSAGAMTGGQRSIRAGADFTSERDRGFTKDIG